MTNLFYQQAKLLPIAMASIRLCYYTAAKDREWRNERVMRLDLCADSIISVKCNYFLYVRQTSYDASFTDKHLAVIQHIFFY